MSRNRAKHKGRRDGGESHVRLYRYELQCPAYRALSTDARALLVEFRALYSGGENRLFMSVREMMERLGIGNHHRVRMARDELIKLGWLRELSPGSFNLKARHATEYALTNEPLTGAPGSVPPKDFMRWQPPEMTASRKNTVVTSTTHGGDVHHARW
ncbi:MAG: hypothetical protein QM661_09690 [Solimonas sp.]